MHRERGMERERDTDKYMTNRGTHRETDSETPTSPTVHQTHVTDTCTDRQGQTDRVAGGHPGNGGCARSGGCGRGM